MIKFKDDRLKKITLVASGKGGKCLERKMEVNKRLYSSEKFLQGIKKHRSVKYFIVQHAGNQPEGERDQKYPMKKLELRVKEGWRRARQASGLCRTSEM